LSGHDMEVRSTLHTACLFALFQLPQTELAL
jgi:hypothetical protein